MLKNVEEKERFPSTPIDERGYPMYEWIKKAGEGAFGSVWEARNLETGKIVAVKIIPLYGLGLLPEENKKIAERVKAEIRLLQKGFKSSDKNIPCHPALACFYDFLTWQGKSYIEMEFITGKNLEFYTRDHHKLIRKLKNNHGLIEAYNKHFNLFLVGVTKHILGGLNYLHKNSIIHRDIKPENILIQDETNKPKLIDIGLGCFTYLRDIQTGEKKDTFCSVSQEDVPCCPDKERIGTPYFMAPETLFNGESYYVSDVWSLGATLYYCVKGQYVYQPKPETMQALINLVKSKDPVPIFPHNYVLTTLIYVSLIKNIWERAQLYELIDIIEASKELTKTGIDQHIVNFENAVEKTRELNYTTAYNNLYKTFQAFMKD